MAPTVNTKLVDSQQTNGDEMTDEVQMGNKGFNGPMPFGKDVVDATMNLQELFNGFQNSQIVYTAVVLRVFEIIGDGELAAWEVADRLEFSATYKYRDELVTNVSRLLNACVAVKVLKKTSASTYKNTTSGYILKDNMFPFNELFHFMPVLYRAFGRLAYNFSRGESNDSIFDERGMLKLVEVKEVNNQETITKMFGKVMSKMTCMDAKAILQNHRVQSILKNVEVCCDVGGGNGSFAKCLARKYPSTKFIVFDKCFQVNNSSKSDQPSTNLKFQSGDFFDKSTIPEAGLYILSHVLVDFGDQMGRKILSNLYGCLKEGQSILILEKILRDDKSGPTDVVLFDMGMMALHKGRERTKSEYFDMIYQSGFSRCEYINMGKSSKRDIIVATK